jgi:very-short-patch-repair endonuclease
MVDPMMRDILVSAAEIFRASFPQVDIEQFFADRSIQLAEGNSKRSYAYNTLAALPQSQALALILEVALEQRRFGLQEAIYEIQDKDNPKITEITRREIAKVIGTRLHGDGARADLLGRLFQLETLSDQFGAFFGSGEAASLKRQIEEKASGPTPAWNASEVFGMIGAFNCSSRRFAQLVDTALDPLLRSAEAQEVLVRQLEPILRVDHYEIVQTGQISGRKTFGVCPIQPGVEGRPKNLIFASNGMKPVLGFRDAIDNDILVLKHADSCLIYDRQIGDGLRWSELVAWWADRERITDKKEARKSLGIRLQQSLNEGPERRFFNAYFKSFAQRLNDRLPALIPQVYLHYDPEVMRHITDRETLLRQRMDFLMLLPGRQRIILEIDGKQHYAEGDMASPRLYSEMASADRELRLRGYEVYRFGGYELGHNRSDSCVRQVLQINHGVR